MSRRILSLSLSLSWLSLVWFVGPASGCRSDPAPTKSTPAAAAATVVNPEQQLIRYGCQGFDKAVAAATPEGRLLSTSARYAVELGGDSVELATQRWALMPPRGLVDLIDRYERDPKVDRQECAGLRAHLERMDQRSRPE